MATSKLQRYTYDCLFTHYGIELRENHRPYWMEGLELDFYIESEKLAVEVQGQQHSSFCAFFHKDQSGFYQQIARDIRKREICLNQGITLHYIFTQSECDEMIVGFKNNSDIEKLAQQEVYDLAKHWASGHLSELRNSAHHLQKHLNKCRKSLLKAVTKKEKKALALKVKQAERGSLRLRKRLKCEQEMHFRYFLAECAPLVIGGIRDNLKTRSRY